MAGPALEFPVLQNWSCHNCGGCCKQHAVFITEAERQRIAQQNWRTEDGVSAGELVVPAKGDRRRPWRLAQTADGSCVFLDERGLCRIHARFGEAAKPLPCRLYPYVFHPLGRKVAVGLRFSCPSVVENRGRRVRDQSGDLRDLASEVVPPGAAAMPPPRIADRTPGTWPLVVRLMQDLDRLFATPGHVAAHLLRGLVWAGLLESVRLDRVPADRLEEHLAALFDAAVTQAPDDLTPWLAKAPPPGKGGLAQFRLLAGAYARSDTFATERSWSERWRRGRDGVRLARGRGLTPALSDELRAVPFDLLDQPFGGLPEGAREMLSRYFRVKIQSLHFCGAAFYGEPFVTGLCSLALVYSCTLWIARWLAASAGRSAWTLDDIAHALAMVDHHHGFSPALGTWLFRRRVRNLIASEDIPRLTLRYTR